MIPLAAFLPPLVELFICSVYFKGVTIVLISGPQWLVSCGQLTVVMFTGLNQLCFKHLVKA